MPRVLKGNRRDIPAGLEPFEWAEEVFTLMDEGKTEEEAKRLVKERYERVEIERS